MVTRRAGPLLSVSAAAQTVLAAEGDTVAELRGLAPSSPAPAEKRRRTLEAYLVGKVIAATGGRADPKIAGEQVAALL